MMTYPMAEDAGASLTLTTQTARGGVTIVSVGGDLDITTAPVLREHFLRLMRPGGSRYVVMLSGVRYADASGLAVLIAWQRRCVQSGGYLRLAAPSPQVSKVLASTGLDRHLDIHPAVVPLLTNARAQRERQDAASRGSSLPLALR